ncbi:hypothetical protein Acid7E03_42030 [Acidisoma sp. 7E03]
MRRIPFAQYHRQTGVLTTMHAKERVMAPILLDGLGLHVELACGVDTDRFGTFSREVERQGSQRAAARAKIAAGFERTPGARVGLASEGSFGPHPHVPFFAMGHEIVMMIDRENGLELIGFDTSPHTNFSQGAARHCQDALAFAEGVGFPEHGVIVLGCREGEPAPDAFLRKDLLDREALAAAVREACHQCGTAFLETDMRAHRNPTRMAAIARATRDLVRRFHSRCPACAYPGFDVTERFRAFLVATVARRRV